MNMKYKTKWGTCLLITTLLLSAFIRPDEDWGFFVHRRINRLAVFTLPVDLIGFYKKNVEYITDHATDPDMRRYVVPIEGIKHYIDLDNWNWKELPKDFIATRRMFTEVFIINEKQDTLRLFGQHNTTQGDWNLILKGDNFSHFFAKDSIVVLKETFNQFFYKQIHHYQYLDRWKLNCDSIRTFFDFHGFDLDCKKAFAIDTFVQHGILPYHLARMQKNLTEAMRMRNVKQILRLSADLGHYIGDAHVPLHTTSNYNGQQTDQVGIHAFWETRLPELFADDTYDYFVGKATYIDKPIDYYWEIVLNSHSLVDEVLGIEKELSHSFPEDQQDCFVERGEGYIQIMACEAYASSYHERLNGQVEKQLRAAILALGNAWYTAWVDAGQPELEKLIDNRDQNRELKEEKALLDAIKKGKIFGRKHE